MSHRHLFSRTIIFAFILLCFSALCIASILAGTGIKELDPNIKIGLYSGTFDPPTTAHNAIIRNSIQHFKLDRLYIFVNKNSNKMYKCSSQQRIEMLERMLFDIKDKVVIIAQSFNQKLDDYLLIKKIIPNKIIHITGEDSYQRRLLIVPEKRINFDAIGIIPRLENSNCGTLELEENAFYIPLADEYKNVSSSAVRKKLKQRNYSNIDLTPEVLSYVVEHKLYRPQNNNDTAYASYLEKYYAYIGRQLTKDNPPEYDNTSSEQAWTENFATHFSNNNANNATVTQ